MHNSSIIELFFHSAYFYLCIIKMREREREKKWKIRKERTLWKGCSIATPGTILWQVISSAGNPGQKCVLFENSSSAMTPRRKAKPIRHCSLEKALEFLDRGRPPYVSQFPSAVYVRDRTRIRLFDLWSTMLFHDPPIESFASGRITIAFQFEWWRPSNVDVIFLTWIEISSCDKYFITAKERDSFGGSYRTEILILSFVDREEFGILLEVRDMGEKFASFQHIDGIATLFLCYW